ncbi:D-alanine--D-alanine ligase [Bacillota bacterium LX-D]|nr:D-alanine--D-alanine ligase [Bacillota bacterium LX-D]
MLKKIAVLYGGKSSEREISIKTGEAVYRALIAKGYEAFKIDASGSIIEELYRIKPDLVFIALHGKFGEDGTIQGMLEILGIPYTGCDVLTSSLAMNKIYTKKILCYEGIPTANFVTISPTEISQKGMDFSIQKVKSQLQFPVVVKAPTQGSTIGIYFVKDEQELAEAINKALQYDPVILIEKLIQGMEVTVSIIGNNYPFPLPLIEIVSKTGVYDYDAKYTVGLSEHIIPARLSKELEKKVTNLALKTYKTIGCRGFSRIDFIIDQNDQPYVLEVNTIPGMTETSLLPDAAKAAGINFPDLIQMIVNLGLGREDIR